MKSKKTFLKKNSATNHSFDFIEDEFYEINQKFSKRKVIANKVKKMKNNKWNESE